LERWLIGALALLKAVVHERRARSTTDAVFLRELAREKSATVHDLSSWSPSSSFRERG
jgi:hypothetical protein